MDMNAVKPLVSVAMITYGHEKFIEQALESILMQECDFDFELIVGDDQSPDDTENIINKIIEKHPRSNIIKYFKHKKK
jgi:glycosyltransferase involved in cell wall biosynthesis